MWMIGHASNQSKRPPAQAASPLSYFCASTDLARLVPPSYPASLLSQEAAFVHAAPSSRTVSLLLPAHAKERRALLRLPSFENVAARGRLPAPLLHLDRLTQATVPTSPGQHPSFRVGRHISQKVLAPSAQKNLWYCI